MFIVINIFSAIVMGLLCSYSAKKRGRNPTIWFCIGLFFGLLGLIILFVMPFIAPNTMENECIKATSPSDKEQIGSEGGVVLGNSKQWFSDQWYWLDTSRKQEGPLAFAALKQSFQEGVLSTRSFVWCADMKEWKRIEELPFLLECLRESA